MGQSLRGFSRAAFWPSGRCYDGGCDERSPTAITIDPSGFFRAGLDSCLAQAGFRVVSHAPGLAVAVRDLDGRTPHLAAVGLNFTEPEAFAVCRRMLARRPEVNILLYTGHAADPLVLADAFHTGIEAVLPREAGTAETLVVIEALLSGRAVFAEEIRRTSPVSLSKREVDVMTPPQKRVDEFSPNTLLKMSKPI